MKISTAWAVLLLVSTACIAAADEEKETPSWEKSLAAKGLHRAHGIYSLDDEKEVSLKYDLFKEAKKSWIAKLNEQANYHLGDQTLKELTLAESNLQAQIKNIGNMSNRMNGRGGRYINSAQRGMIQEANMEKGELQNQLNAVRQQKNYLGKNLPNPAKRKEIDAEVTSRKNELVVAIGEMKQAIEDVKTKYEEISADPKVKRSLAAAGQGLTVKPKIGPSKAMTLAEQEMVKLAKQLHLSGFAATAHPRKKANSKPATADETE